MYVTVVVLSVTSFC